MRGSLFAIGLACLLSGLLAISETLADSTFKVTLIGTGSPIPRLDRFGPSTLVEAGNQKLLIDAGRGAQDLTSFEIGDTVIVHHFKPELATMCRAASGHCRLWSRQYRNVNKVLIE
jgi:hypothetical protein